MSLVEQIRADVIKALKKSEGEVALTLRQLLAAIKNKEIDLKKREEGTVAK